MKLLMRMIPIALVELVARLAGYAVGVPKPHGSYKAERIVRGRYWGWRLSGSQLWIGRGVQFEGTRIKLGSKVRLYDGGHYVTGSSGWVNIGSGTHISRKSIVSGLGGVDIGEGCAISAMVAIYSSTTDTNAPVLGTGAPIRKPVRIGDHVYIGVGAKILPGVTIGDDAVVAAGAVVIGDVPSGTLARGVPAVVSPLANRRSLEPGEDAGGG
jgi:acetyltransferase-like isoleucine patch superfamily enzyme